MRRNAQQSADGSVLQQRRGDGRNRWGSDATVELVARVLRWWWWGRWRHRIAPLSGCVRHEWGQHDVAQSGDDAATGDDVGHCSGRPKVRGLCPFVVVFLLVLACCLACKCVFTVTCVATFCGVPIGMGFVVRFYSVIWIVVTSFDFVPCFCWINVALDFCFILTSSFPQKIAYVVCYLSVRLKILNS